jgi:hypothetical protein
MIDLFMSWLAALRDTRKNPRCAVRRSVSPSVIPSVTPASSSPRLSAKFLWLHIRRLDKCRDRVLRPLSRFRFHFVNMESERATDLIDCPLRLFILESGNAAEDKTDSGPCPYISQPDTLTVNRATNHKIMAVFDDFHLLKIDGSVTGEAPGAAFSQRVHPLNDAGPMLRCRSRF